MIGMGRVGHAVLGASAWFFVSLFLGVALKSNIPPLAVELAFLGIGLGLILVSAAARPTEAVWGRFSARDFFLFMLAMTAAEISVELSRLAFGWEKSGISVDRNTEAAALMGIAIVAPVLEEVIFRQFLFRALNVGDSHLALLLPILGTSALFALSHLAYWGTASLLFVALAGVIMGVAKVRSGGILLPLSMHAGMNTLFILRGVVWH